MGFFSNLRKRREIISKLNGYQGQAFSSKYDFEFTGFSSMDGNPAKEASAGYRESIAIIQNTPPFFFESERSYAQRLLQSLQENKKRSSDIAGGTAGATETAITSVKSSFKIT